MIGGVGPCVFKVKLWVTYVLYFMAPPTLLKPPGRFARLWARVVCVAITHSEENLWRSEEATTNWKNEREKNLSSDELRRIEAD